MSKKLLVRPDPFYDESLLSYILRLSEANGYESPKDILSIFQSTGYRFTSNLPKRMYSDAEPLLELTGKSYSTLEHMIYSRINNKEYKFLNAAVTFKMIEPCRPKFCPFCLKESRYYRMLWDFSLITLCLTHKCLLISDCPRCQGRLDIYYKGFGQCKCGFDLCSIQTVEQIPESDFRVSQYIHLLLGLKTSKNNLISSDNPLINFSLNEFSILIDYFSKLLLRMYDPEYNPKRKESSIHNLHHSLLFALTIFDNFPQNYLIFVQQQIQADCFSENDHHYSTFSRYYPCFHTVAIDTTYSFIYKAFTENIYSLLEENSIVSERKRYMPSSKYISIADAKKHLKIKKSEFDYLLSSGKLKTKYFSEQRNWLIELKSYLKFKSEKMTLITDSSLSSQLSISVELVRQLVHIGCLPVKMERHENGQIYYLFQGDLFIKLLSKIRSRIKAKRKISRDKLLNFEEIEETLKPDIIALSHFTLLCIIGKIRPKEEIFNEKGLNRFLFAEKDLEKFIDCYM